MFFTVPFALQHIISFMYFTTVKAIRVSAAALPTHSHAFVKFLEVLLSEKQHVENKLNRQTNLHTSL